MKKLFTILMLGAAVCATSCSDDDFVEAETFANYTDINGDEITLSSWTNYSGFTINNIYTAADLGEGSVVVTDLFTTNNCKALYASEYNADWYMWNGFTISQNCTTAVDVESWEGSANYAYEFAAYANGDSDGDNKFAYAYCNDAAWGYANNSIISFVEPTSLTSVDVAIAAISASYLKRADDWGTPISDYSLDLTITVKDAAGDQIGSTIAVELFDEEYNAAFSGWKTIDLSGYSGASSVEFYASYVVDGGDSYIPMYFCVDALKIVE